jgi:hypothetical protein
VKSISTTLFTALLVSALSCSSVWAQATAQMSGIASDQSGAVLPGVEIIATQTATGISRSAITNETGSYVLPNLSLGPYKVEASLPGFRTFVQTGIVLQVNSNPVVNIVMQVGDVSEQVEVQANAALVETRSLSIGQVMETERIVDLPLNGRNAQELVLLSGAATQVSKTDGYIVRGKVLLSTAGGMPTSTEYTLDGARHIDSYDGFGLPLPFPDALAEFKAEIGGMAAQQAKGSQIGAVTKSGTNQFHGNLFEFVRNDLFNARNYFATKTSTLKRNQFGGTLGGPVVKNKLFFFGAYQGTTLRQDPSDVRAFVPTAAMLAGDFTAFTSAACNGGRPLPLKAPFVDGRVDPALFSRAALNLTAHLPKTNNPCAEITYGQRNVEDMGQVVSKVDYQLRPQHSLFGRLLYSFDNTDSPVTNDNVLTSGGSLNTKFYAITLGSTYLLSPTSINAFRLSVTRGTNSTLPNRSFDATDIGSKVYVYIPKMMNITVTNGFSMGGNYRRQAQDMYQLSDDVNMTHGAHQFAFGGRLTESRTNSVTSSTINPNFQFNGSITGTGLGDMLLGKLNQYVQGRGGELYGRSHALSVYAQDVWQLRRRVSVSYGLRWEPVLPLVDVRRPVPLAAMFDIERYKQGLRSTVFVNAPPGFLYAGDHGFTLDNNGVNAEKPRANAWNPYWNQFAPRVGFAWDIEGNGRSSLRASYGLNYEEYGPVRRQGAMQGQAPWGSTTRLLVPAGGFDDPWLGVSGGNPFPLALTKNMPFISQGDYLPNTPDLVPTYIQSWNLSLQREFVRDMLFSVSYLGNGITHLQTTRPLNLAVYVPGAGDANGNCFFNGTVTPFKVSPGATCSTSSNTQARRELGFRNPAFSNEIGRLGVVENGGTQNYHGMLVSVQRRPRQGVNINANYTWSHCLGDYSGRAQSGAGTGVDHTYQDRDDRGRDRGNCEVDQRHIFNLTSVAETPQFANRTLRIVGSGWRLSGIYRRYTNSVTETNQASGTRTVILGTAVGAGGANGGSSGGDRCLCDISFQRPNLILPDAVYLDRSGRPGTQYLNPAAFGDPALGTLGNLGRSNLKLPTAWQFDLALARVFRFRETNTLEFRGEAYNVTNSFRSGEIDTGLTSAQFGKIRNSLEPRILQFVLKYAF